MRAIGGFLLGIVAAVLLVAFGLFALENGQMTQFSFLGNTMRMNLWLLVGIPAVIGFLLALLLVTPARAAGDRHGSALRGQYRSLERELADQRRQIETLHTENSRWQTRYQQMVAERNDLNTRLATVQQAAMPVRDTPVRDTPVRETPVRETMRHETPVPDTSQRETTDYSETPATRQREEAVAPMGYDGVRERQPVAAGDTSMADERPVTADRPVTDEAVAQREPVQPPPPTQPTLGERLRGIFGGERTAEEEEADRINSRGPAPTI